LWGGGGGGGFLRKQGHANSPESIEVGSGGGGGAGLGRGTRAGGITCGEANQESGSILRVREFWEGFGKGEKECL